MIDKLDPPSGCSQRYEEKEAARVPRRLFTGVRGEKSEILGSPGRITSQPLVTMPRHGCVCHAGDGGEITLRDGPIRI